MRAGGSFRLFAPFAENNSQKGRKHSQIPKGMSVASFSFVFFVSHPLSPPNMVGLPEDMVPFFDHVTEGGVCTLVHTYPTSQQGSAPPRKRCRRKHKSHKNVISTNEILPGFSASHRRHSHTHTRSLSLYVCTLRTAICGP